MEPPLPFLIEKLKSDNKNKPVANFSTNMISLEYIFGDCKRLIDWELLVLEQILAFWSNVNW